MPNKDFSQSLLFALAAAALGGFLAKKLKSQPLIGYILGGVVIAALIPSALRISSLADIGVILLLFSLGLELSFSRLSRVLKPALLGAGLQALLMTGLGYLFLTSIGFERVSAVIFSLGISFSSTAVVVKTLADRGENETLHGLIMDGWLLVQDLAVIPMVVLINALASHPGSVLAVTAGSLFKASYVILIAVILGRHLVPWLIHKIASVNSRELLTISVLAIATGTAYVTYLLGISPSLGAFLAGLVISESLENYEILGEIRPLRDLFVAIFFVTLGFMIKIPIFISNLPQILAIFAFIMICKILVNFFVSLLLGYKGKTAVAIGLGLSQVGEFSFVIFSLALSLNLISANSVSVVIAAILLTLLITPFLFKSITPLWRKLKEITSKVPAINKIFLGGEKSFNLPENLSGHIIICGYGRVGGWVGRALSELDSNFVIIDYNQAVVTDLLKKSLPVIYGDPTEPEVLEAAGIRDARVVVLAIPDRTSQEILLSYVQTVAPKVKIISRVHLDSDWERLKTFRVHKLIQPEFEAAIAMTRSILSLMGKPREEINERVKKLRLSHSLK